MCSFRKGYVFFKEVRAMDILAIDYQRISRQRFYIVFIGAADQQVGVIRQAVGTVSL